MHIIFSTWQIQVLLFRNFLEFFILHIFHPSLVESWDAEPTDMKGLPYSFILVKPQLQGTAEDWLPEQR